MKKWMNENPEVAMMYMLVLAIVIFGVVDRFF